MAEDCSKRPLAYIIGTQHCSRAAFRDVTADDSFAGKAEEFANQKNSLHGHVTALTGPLSPPKSQL
jgi:hypothetical protein